MKQHLLLLRRHYFVIVLCYILELSAVTSVNGQFSLNPNEDETNGRYEPPPRVIIEPFEIILQSIDEPLGDRQLRHLLDIMEGVVMEYIIEDARPTGRNIRQRILSELKYIRFGGTKQEHRGDTLTLLVGAGVASYSDHPIPDSSVVNEWVKDGLENYLVPELQDDNYFQSVNTVLFDVQRPPNDNNSEEPVDDGDDSGSSSGGGGGGGGLVTDSRSGEIEPTSSASGKPDITVIAGVAAGVAVICIVIVGLFIVRSNHRKKRCTVVEIEDLGPLEEYNKSHNKSHNNNDRDYNNNDDIHQTPRTQRDIDGGRSVADSESEWTMATEAGDTSVLKNIHHNSALTSGVITNNNNNTTILQPNRIMPSESFERQRPVSISKDMLTGAWSGKVSNQRVIGHQTESVLKPSYFSAKDERAARASSDREASSIGSDGSSRRSNNPWDAGYTPTPPSSMNMKRTRPSPNSPGRELL